MTDDDVKLPEPIGYLYHDSISAESAHPWLHSTMLVLAADRRPTCRNETPLYDEPTVRRLIAEAVEKEREACAVLCDLHSRLTWNDDRKAQSRLLAAEIRRGPKTNHGSNA